LFLICWYIGLYRLISEEYESQDNTAKSVLEENTIEDACIELKKEKIPCTNEDMLCYVLWKIVDFTSQSSIALMIFVFIYLSLDAVFCLERSKLGSFTLITLMRLLSVSAIPTGISLVICAYDMTLIQYMSGVEIYIAFAGISIGLVAFLSTFLEFILEEEIKKKISHPNQVQDVMDK
jgi:hypothetical protein